MDPASLITGLFQLYVDFIYLRPVGCTLLETTIVARLKWPTPIHWRVTALYSVFFEHLVVTEVVKNPFM